VPVRVAETDRLADAELGNDNWLVIKPLFVAEVLFVNCEILNDKDIDC
jgi:hypothetical protein